MASATSIFWSKLAALILSCAITTTLACSPVEPITGSTNAEQGEISKKVDLSEIVALGKVISSTPNDEKNKMGWNVSTVEFEVYCTFKGGPLKQMLRIENVGQIPGLCHTKNLPKSDDLYLVYLKDKKDGTFELVDTPQDQVPTDQEEAYIDEVNACGVETTFPTDVDENDRKSRCRGSEDTFPVSSNCPEVTETKAPATTTTIATTPKESLDEVAENGPAEDKNIEASKVVGSSDKKENSANSRCISIFVVIFLVLTYFIL